MEHMKTPGGSFVQTADHLLEMKTGGGCLSLFGLPFFGAGLFMLLITLRVIPLSNADEMKWWTWLVLAGMGLIFSAVGGALVFGRTWHTLDRRQMRAWIAKGLLKPMRTSSYDLHLFNEVALRYEKGDSDTADKYPLVLISSKNQPELVLLNASSYGQARSQAILIGEFLGFEVTDLSSLVPQPLQNDPGPIQTSARPKPPFQPGFELRESQEEVYIAVHGKGISRAKLGCGFIPLLMFLIFAWNFLGILWSPGTPVFVRLFFLGFLGLFFVLLPLLELLKALRRRGKPIQELRIGKAGLELGDPAAKQTLKLGWEDVFGVDYLSLEASLQTSDKRYHQIDPEKLPDWLKRLSRTTGSRGLVIKAQDGLHYFGTGLSDEELVYLNVVVNEALARFKG